MTLRASPGMTDTEMELNVNAGFTVLSVRRLERRLVTTVTILVPTVELISNTLARTADASTIAKVGLSVQAPLLLRPVILQYTRMKLDALMPLIGAAYEGYTSVNF